MPKNKPSLHGSIFFRFIPPAIRRLCLRLALGLAILFTVYALAGFLLAPSLLNKFLPQYAAEQLHARLTMETIRINPLLFTCEIKGLRLVQEGEDEPLLAVERLFVDFETDSLFHRAWTFADLVVEKPALRLAIDSEGRLNLARLNPSGSAEAEESEANPTPAEPQPLPRLYLQHFSLSGGSASLTDQSKKSTPKPFAIDPLNIELVKVSTLPEQRGAYAVSAALPEGGSLAWKGDLSLTPILATGSLELKDFKPAAIWRFLPERIHIAPVPGTLALTADYHFSLLDGKPALEMHPVTITIQGLAVQGTNAPQPIVKLNTLTASGGRIDLTKHQVLFPAIAVHGLTASTSIDSNGRGNWEGLVEPEEDEEPSAPWQIGIDSLTVADSTVGFSSDSPANPINLNLDLTKLSLANATIDLAKRQASGKHLALSGGGLALNMGIASPAKPVQTPAKGQQTSQEPPWKTSLDQLAIHGFRIGFTDQATKIAYTLHDLTAAITDIGHTTQPISFDLKTGVEQGGEATLRGAASQKGDRIEAQAHIAHFSLKPLDGLVDRKAAVALISGSLSADVRLLRTQNEQQQATLTLDGDASINDLHLREDDTGDRLLAWKEATVSGLALSLNPDRLTIREVRMQEPGTKIIIFKDKSINLAKLRKQETQAQPSAPIVADKDQKPFPVTVERVRLENGVVDFADFSLVLPFATRIHQCKGSANSISSEPASKSALKFDGRVGEFGQAKASGSLMPFAPKRFTDITVLFRNVAMAPLSPYTATFAGRTIASGKLNLDLEYKIKESELAGKNSVVMEDFTLGDRVESPNAMSLPLDLAIALLTDSQGKIDLAVPINGNVDHPKFSYGVVVREAIFNLLSKVVTAPFRALASLFGNGTKNPDAVLFEPGSADVTPPEQEKLKAVSGVLDKKKQLVLTVHGGFAPALDGTALKTAHIRQALAQKLGAKLRAGEEPDPVAFDNGKTQRALESLAGDEGLKIALAEYEKSTGNKAKRVNPALALIGKGSEDSDFYQALFAYLVKSAPLPQAELEKLADQRGKAIAQELTDRAGTDSTRITVGPAVQSEEEDGAVPAKLELGLR